MQKEKHIIQGILLKKEQRKPKISIKDIKTNLLTYLERVGEIITVPNWKIIKTTQKDYGQY